MGNDAKRTPGPWYVRPDKRGNRLEICRRWDEIVKPENTATFGSCYGAHIAEMHYNSGVPTPEQAEANAAFIIRAANAHGALLAAAQEMLAAWDGYEMLAALDYRIRERVVAAIALAMEANDEAR